MKTSTIAASATRSEAALAAVLNGHVAMAMAILTDMPPEDQYKLRAAAETLAELCKKP
jgi:hypothetical protein